MIARPGGSERVYRAILSLYPASFRRRFADEMTQLFRDRLRDVGTAGSALDIAIAWLRMVADVALTAPAEHLRRNRTVAHSLSSAPTPVTRVLGIAGVVAGLVILLVYGIELPEALYPARLVVFGLGVMAIAVGVHQRQAVQAPSASLMATGALVGATGAWLGTVLLLPPGHIAGFWLSVGLWVAMAAFGAVATGIGAVSRIGAAGIAAGALLAVTGIDRLGLVSNVAPTIFNTLSQIGIVTMALGWVVLGIDIALRARVPRPGSAGSSAGAHKDLNGGATDEGDGAIRFAWALPTAGILYALLQASAVTDIGLGDDLLRLGLAMHAVILVVAMIGLIGVGTSLRLTGWTAATWWASTALALLGLVVAHVFWSGALIGIAAVLVVRFGATLAGAAMASGGVLWLYLYLVGVRIGNDEGRAITSAETAIALCALALMAVAFAAAPWGRLTSDRLSQPAPQR